ncbi:hypothetical protein [Clostridium tyrobutyricum]|jgi:hypothetical protein|uniref:hypothetical protein n=1 Tax=Clostridium tyrobutyricum TaxID=1519 RepID=UPI00190F4684|nr:hypothetical protein [Clostridium tyrobutyricum]
MTYLGSNILGAYSLVATIALAIYHTSKCKKEHDSKNQLVIVLLIPVIIFLANVI